MPPRRLRCLAAAALLALIAPAASAQSLEEAMTLSYTTNPTLLAARQELRAVDEQIAQAMAGWRPTVQGQGQLAYERQETDISPWESTHPNEYSISLSQPLYRGGGTVAGVSQAENIIEAQRANLTATEQQVLLDTVAAYMNVVLARAILQLTENNEARLARQLEATEDRFRVGEVTRTDVSQARARFANAQAERVSAEGDLSTAAARFEEVIGVMPTELSRPGPLVGGPGALDEAMTIADAENPLIRAAIATELAAQDGIDVQEADLLPDLALIASYTHSEDLNAVFAEQNTAAIIAQLTIPLYQAGFEESQLRAARSTAAQRRIEVDEARRQVLAQLVSAWQDLETAQAQIAAFTEEVNANQIALEGTEREAQVGERTVLDILDAEQELFQSQINLANAQRNEVVASYTLQAALGRLTAAYLRLPVELYDVERHYEEARDDWGIGEIFVGE